MAVTASGVQQMGGPASSAAQALATELVDYISGASKRAREQELATGIIVGDQEAKQALVDEVTAKITAVIPNPKEANKSASGAASTPAHKS